jgi:hypothetical protein
VFPQNEFINLSIIEWFGNFIKGVFVKLIKYLFHVLLINILFSVLSYAQVYDRHTTCGTEMAEIFTRAGQFKEAACFYDFYLQMHPDDRNAYIDYAEVERLLENYEHALCILSAYSNRFGIDKDYLEVKARIYADAGFYCSALRINNYLLRENPHDGYIIATQASALYESGRPAEALATLDYLTRTDPDSDDINFLNATIREPLLSSISLGDRYSDLSLSSSPMDIPSTGQFIYQNDSVKIIRLPLLIKLYLSPNTNLLFQGLYEHYSAGSNSGLTTINGQTSIHDEEFQVGVEHLVPALVKVRASLGGLFISNGHSFLVYNIGGKFFVSERLALSLAFVHELFRPIDLTNGSPRSVSLGILETGARAHINYKTSLQSTLDIDLRASALSRSNNYTRLSIEPGTVIYNTNISTLEAGLNFEFLSFKRDLPQEQDGYYSPRFYQAYELILLYKLHPIDNFLLQFLFGAGIAKDNHSAFGPANDTAIEASYTVCKHVDLIAAVDYVYRGISPAYYEADGSLGITWRF